VSYAWLPALRFRSPVQTESSSIFFRSRSLPDLELRPLGSAGNLPASPLGQPGLLTIRNAQSPLYCVVHGIESPKRQRHYGKGVPERKNGHGFTETVTETATDERKRNAGNQALGFCTYLARRLDSLENADENNDPSETETQSDMPAHLSHVTDAR